LVIQEENNFQKTSKMIQFLIDNFELTAEEAKVFSASFFYKNYSKGAIFIPYGKTCNQIGFVKEGILKCVTIGKNKEIIDDFTFENQFVTNYYSFLTETKSTKNIICIADCSLLVIDRKKLQLLSQNHPFIEQIARKVTEKLYLSLHQKINDLRLLNAEERYLKLFKSNKRILTDIPQYDIASYLNVSPETVSRIRKKVTNISS